jgi:hypothetical protein
MKRFTETDKWRDPWFRSLPPAEKLVFLFVIENCNNAGFYEIDYGLMAFATGLDQSALQGAIKGLIRGLVNVDGWVWVRTFLKHQKNDNLNPENKAHKQIIGLVREQLVRFAKCEEFKNFVAPYKGLTSPTGTVQVKVKVRKEGVQREGFDQFWSAYPRKDAKADAVKAWGKVDVDVAVLITAIERQKTSFEWTKQNGQFIPLPASWLNGKRWEDGGTQIQSAGCNGSRDESRLGPTPVDAAAAEFFANIPE